MLSVEKGLEVDTVVVIRYPNEFCGMQPEELELESGFSGRISERFDGLANDLHWLAS